MSEISTLAAANFLTQVALPLIQAATALQLQGKPSTQDTVSISSEAKLLHAHHN